MKITIERSNLLNALGHVQSVVEKRTTIPILSNVLLTATNGVLTLCATDMDLEITDAVEANIVTEGSTTTPAHTFYDIIRKLPDESTIELELNEAGTAMTVTCGRSVFKLGCLPRDDFPEMTTNQTSHGFTVPASVLKDMIDRTRFAISTEETRYYLNGIYLHATTGSEGDVLRAVATDGHRLARYEKPLPEGATGIPGVIIPRKTVQELRKLLDESGDDIKIDLSDKMVRFTFGHIVLTSKLIDGTFPDYERVIPTNNNKILDVDPKLFTKAVDRVSTIAAEKTRAIKLSIKGTTMTLSANNAESGSATEEIEVAYEDTAELDIGFNARYLLDVTQQLGNSCRLTMEDQASPTIVQDNDDPSSLYVLMPMRV